jgi:drug/metabolite transporter, DME family
MIGVVLALLSAAVSGFSVVLVRRYSAESNALNMSLIITCVGMVVLWPLAIALTSFNVLTWEGFVFFAVSGVLSPGLVRLFYYKGLKKLGASGNAAVFSIYPLYSTLLAVVLLSELLFWQNWLGIALIIGGVIFVELSLHSNNGGEEHAGRRSLFFPVLGGITLGVSSIIRKYALNLSDTPILGVAVAYTFSLLPYALILMASVPSRKELSLKKGFRWFWVAGIGQAITWVLAFYALSVEQVSIVTPLLSIEPLFVVVFMYFYLNKLERVSLKTLVSIGLIVAGVTLVTI